MRRFFALIVCISLPLFSTSLSAKMELPTLSDVEKSEIDKEIANFGNECKSTALLEKAVSSNYKKAQTYQLLLEMNELCDNFAVAQKMRDDNPNIDGMPFIQNSKPFPKSTWQVACDKEPIHLKNAMNAKYQVFHIGTRLGKFYLNCGRPKDALEALKAAKTDVKKWETGSKWRFNNEAHDLKLALAQANLMDNNIKEAVSNYADLVAGETIKSPPEYGDEEYEKRLSEAKSLLMRADNAGVDSGFYLLDKKIINLAYDSYYEGKQKWLDYKLAQEEKNKPVPVADTCTGIANEAVDVWNAYTKRTFNSADARIDYLRGVCNISQQAQNKANYNKCSPEVKQKIVDAIRFANNEMGSLSAYILENGNRYVSASCVGGN